MSKSGSFAALAIGAAALGFAAAPANAFPGIGNDTLGPTSVITVTNSGATVAAGPGSAQGPYENVEDSYVGLVNNSSQTIFSIGLSGTNILGFDGDGIGAGIGGNPATYPGAGGCSTSGPCTPAAAGDNSLGGYGGPLGSFNVTDANNGLFLIAGGLAPGASTFFALESVLTSANISITSINTPLPPALPLFAGGLGLMGLLGRLRKKRKTATA